LGDEPSTLVHAAPALHVLSAALQYSPVVCVQMEDAPHKQTPSLAALPTVCLQSGADKQMQLRRDEHEPVGVSWVENHKE
jgi:hypothetical protein